MIKSFITCAILVAEVAHAKSPLLKKPILTRQEKFEHAISRANAEQAIEDYNAFQRCEGSLHRRVICLPLTEHFDPPPGQQGHGKLQVSDRVSIPKELMMGVFKRCPVPPWQFEIRKISEDSQDALGEEEEDDDDDVNDEDQDPDAETESVGRAPDRKEDSKELQRLYCHVLDWQAPRNYVFVPRWMMQALKLRPRECVELTWCRLREGKQVTLKPHTPDFVNWANPQAVMESELKYYSSLTLGSTILIDYKGAKHALEVVRVVDGEEQLDGANIQDVNVAVEFEGVGPRSAKKGKAKKRPPRNVQ